LDPALWYFDVVSPFAYLHYHTLRPLRERIEIRPVPVLFAGLLKYWGTKGPAEVPPKRLHTYQYCVWAASRLGVAFRMPARHPFNPLAAQRLLIAVGATNEAVEKAFTFVYGEGRDPELDLDAFSERLEVTDPRQCIADPQIKQQLLANTQAAAGRGVFGVPTLAVGGRLFWGSDTVEWTTAFLDDPALFDKPEYRAAAGTQFGVARD